MKVVCLGDSLTSGYKKMQSRIWPALVGNKYNIEIINSGIIGDTTAGMLSRFYNDVVFHKPSHAIIMGGTNDLIWDVHMELIKTNIYTMVMHCYHHRIIPVIGIPIPLDAETAPKYWTFTNNFIKVNQDLMEYRNWIFKFVKNFQCQAIDFYAGFWDSNLQSVIKSYYSDGVHPTFEGNRVMADIVQF